MKRFLLFAGYDGLAFGGWHEHRSQFDAKVLAIASGTDLCVGPLAYDWWHVVDSNTGGIVKQGTAN